jgi:glucose/arabinose dehydrogenase/mono/diheme cytochrome c family protein
VKNFIHNCFLIAWTCILFCFCRTEKSVDQNVIATDGTSIAQGKILFTQYCSTCHNFNYDAIGPKLGGITDSLPLSWIKDFIRNPKRMIDANDDRAKRLYAKNKSIMPPFAGLGDSTINNVISFIHTKKARILSSIYDNRDEIKNPIPDTITRSNLVVNLKLIAQFPVTSSNGEAPLARITKLDYEPHSGQSFVLDLNGKLYKLENDKPSVYMDMAKLKTKFINQPGLGSGFGSFAFHPEFYKNGLIYTSHTEPAGTQKADFTYEDTIESTLQFVISEWRATDPNKSIFEGQGRELFRIDMVSRAHGIQEIAFNPIVHPGDDDYGKLYITIGDGGAVENRYAILTHHINRAWGTLFRIDPLGKNSKNNKYGIPSSNPFIHNPNAIGEIYAYGFRNPHRITWTRKGQLLLSNIGHGDIEALDLILPGHDYGWPVMEGKFLLDSYGDLTKVYPTNTTDTIQNHITFPVVQYDHDEGKAISGGYEYTGSIPELKGKFLFGDIPLGTLYFVNTNDIQQGRTATIKEWSVSMNDEITTLKKLCGNDRVDLHFGRDAKGEMYMMTKADGKLYRLSGTNRSK